MEWSCRTSQWISSVGWRMNRVRVRFGFLGLAGFFCIWLDIWESQYQPRTCGYAL